MSALIKNHWLENWLPRPNARFRIFCFPHVGGSASLYRLWPMQLKEEVDLLAVELPGRGRRFGETLFTNLQELIAAFHREILPFLDKPFFVFGHSMGALMAYEWSALLEKENRSLPLNIFLSAFGAPHVTPAPKKLLHLLSDSDFLEELEHLKGTPPEVLKHQELMSLLLPMIRADLKMVETYQYNKASKLSVPLRVLGGTQDPQVDLNRLAAWKELTSSSFDLKLFEGDHFFIQSVRDQVVSYVLQEIEKHP